MAPTPVTQSAGLTITAGSRHGGYKKWVWRRLDQLDVNEQEQTAYRDQVSHLGRVAQDPVQKCF